MTASNYLETAILDHILGEQGSDFTSPATLYVGLHTADPGEDGSNELPTSNGYARTACNFAAASGDTCAISGEVSFTASGGDWTEVTHFCIWDASSSGNCLFSGALAAAKTVTDGDTLTFPATTGIIVTAA